MKKKFVFNFVAYSFPFQKSIEFLLFSTNHEFFNLNFLANGSFNSYVLYSRSLSIASYKSIGFNKIYIIFLFYKLVPTIRYLNAFKKINSHKTVSIF